MLLRGLIVAGATVLLFLLLYVVRDILLRTRSFAYQLVCIMIVALLPIVGFLVYLLIRPARTVKQREQEHLLRELLENHMPKDEGKEQSKVDTSKPAPSDAAAKSSSSSASKSSTSSPSSHE